MTDSSGYKTELETKPEARSPEAAREMIEKDVPDDCEIVTLIPASAWHTFIRARSWKKV